MTEDIENLEKLAIKAAISQEWEQAVEQNKLILEKEPNNISALNRLGTAYIKTGHQNSAKQTFSLVLKTDPRNQIAKNNLVLSKTKLSPSINSESVKEKCLTSFIEEPGKSKVVSLVKTAEPKVILSLYVGQEVFLKPGKHKISVTDQNKKFLGYLPDNIATRLIHFIRSGYHYQVCVKSTNPKNFSIFIKEKKQSKKLKGAPSFSVNGDILPKLDAGEPNLPPLEIFDPLIPEDSY